MTKHSPLFRFIAPIGIGLGIIAGPAVGVPSPARAACSSFIVEKGDSWSLLADYAGVGLSSLLRANNATAKTVILPGKQLCLPKGATFNRPGQQPKAEASSVKITLPKKRYTAAESEAIIRDIFPDKLERRAVTIAKRESHLNAVSYGWCCYGLFQIYFNANKEFLGTLGVTHPSQLLDAHTNATVAYAMYQRSGWGPWE
jgi:LysM repeat protein